MEESGSVTVECARASKVDIRVFIATVYHTITEIFHREQRDVLFAIGSIQIQGSMGVPVGVLAQ
jgi:hypothetical protein